MFNFLKLLLIWSIRFLIGLSILLILYTLFCNAFKYKFGNSPNDIEFFFSLFKPYSSIIVLTFTIIGIYLIIEQIDISTQSKEIRKITDWKIRLITKLENIELENPLMYQHIFNNLNEIYEYLAKKQFRISNKKQLKAFFDTFLINKINDYEKSSSGYDENNGEYENDTVSYSYNNFMEFVFELIEPDFHYYNFNSDFKKLYLNNINRKLK